MAAKDKFISEGYQAYWQGEQEGDNPYDHYLHGPQHELWLEGYYDAADYEMGMEQ